MLSLIYIAFNETFANWQSLWLCGLVACLVVTLQGRGTRKTENQKPAASADIATL